MKRPQLLLGIGILLIVIAVLFWVRLDDWFEPLEPVITSEGVGLIQLGQPLPAEYVKDKAQLQNQYVYGFYADAQPYEGFVLANPPLKVAIQNGPFLKWDQAHKVFQEPPVDQLKADLLKLPAADMQVEFLVIESPRLKTEKGIGVGSTLAEIKQAYGEIRANPVPPSFGGDEYAVMPWGLEQVVFYFKDKQAAQAGGKVKRIMIFAQPS